MTASSRSSEAALARLGLIAPQRRPAIPGGPQDVASALDRWVAERPNAEALVGRHSRYSFRELDRTVNEASAALASLGIGEGDRVACCAPNHPDFLIAFLASQRLGAIWAGINKPLAAPEKRHIIVDSGARVVLAGREAIGQLRELRDMPGMEHLLEMEAGDPSCEWARLVASHRGAPRPTLAIDPFAPALISYTSGTTGLPKGAVHTQHNAMVVGLAMNAHGMADAGRRHGIVLALTINNMLIIGALLAWAGGSPVVCIDKTDTATIVDFIKRERVETLATVPTMLYDLLNNPAVDPQDIASLIRPKSGGAALPEEFRAAFRARFGVELRATYGLTEAPTVVTQTGDREPPLPLSSGKPLPQLAIRICDDAGADLPLGEIGEICVGAAGPEAGEWAGVYTPMLGYWNRPDASAEALRNGWLRTADLGYVDRDGNLFVKDRKKEMIIRGGSNIYPAEIERVLQQDARVQACAVVGKPDARLGEIVVAFIQPVKDAAEAALRADLKAACERELARYKWPSEWIVVSDFPRNAMGKIIKPALKKTHFS
jgi:long-chain acyl-CoA synthetase